MRFTATLFLVAVLCQFSYADSLVNGGFDAPGNPESRQPTTAGIWSGDPTMIVSATQGVTPFSGDFMLQFTGTSPAGPVGFDSGLWQLTDVRHLRSAIDAGDLEAELSAWFNRVHLNDTTDTMFALRLTAFGNTLAEFPGVFTGTGLANVSVDLIADSDVSTWENLSGSFVIPPGTMFLATELRAVENVFNDGSPPEFDGHFVDAVTLVIPEPSGALLAIIGAALGIPWLSRCRLFYWLHAVANRRERIEL